MSPGIVSRLSQGVLWVATATSGLSDALDLPGKLAREMPESAEAFRVGATVDGYWWIGALVGAGLLVTRLGRKSNSDTKMSWRAIDQVQARRDFPAYAAMIRDQPLVMDMSSTELADRTGYSVDMIEEFRAKPHVYPRRDVVENLAKALILPKDACSPRGALQRGVVLDESLLRDRLLWLSGRRLIPHLVDKKGHDVAARLRHGRVRLAELQDIHSIAMAKRYEDLHIDLDGGAI